MASFAELGEYAFSRSLFNFICTFYTFYPSQKLGEGGLSRLVA